MKLDLNKSLSIHIGGEVAKNNSLPLEYFIDVSKSLQELILTLAKTDLNDDLTIDLNNFKIELCGFKEGSAVPQYRFTDKITYAADVDVVEQRKVVNESLDNIFKISDSGNYQELKKLYKSPDVRNEVVEKIYNFTNSFGTAPVEIVNYTKGGKIIKLYRNNNLKLEAKKSLLVTIKEIKPKEVTLYESAVGKVSIIKKGDGKPKAKLEHIYREKDSIVSFKFKNFQVNKRKYTLFDYFIASIEKEDDFIVVKSDILGITGTGPDQKTAIISFYEEFDFIYTRYNELNSTNSSARIIRIKNLINSIVSKVEKA